MLHLFRLISFRYLWSKKTRVALSLGAVTLGVSMVMAVAVLNQSILASYRQLLSDLSGRASLQVSSPANGGLDPALTVKVAEVDGVAAVAPVVRNNSFVRSGEQEEPVLLYGVDVARDSVVRDYPIAEGEAISGQPEGILLAQSLAGTLGVAPGDTVELLTGSGFKLYKVAGILAPSPVARANGGRMAIMSLPAAQRAFGRGDRIDLLDIVIKKGVSTDRTAGLIRQVVGSETFVGPPAGRGQEMEDMLQSMKILLTWASLMSILVAAFMIYNNISMGVKDRRQSLSIMRAVGMRKKDLFRMIMGEALLLGIAGTVLGVAAGAGMAKSMASTISTTVLAIFKLDANQLQITPLRMAVVITTGVLSTLVAAYVPARQALEVSPVEALRPAETKAGPLSRRFSWIGLGLIVAGWVLAAWSLQGATVEHYNLYMGFQWTGALAIFLGVVLILPALITGPLTTPVHWALKATLGLPGWLAADNLRRVPGRTAATIAAMVIPLAMLVGVGTLSYNFQTYVSGWADRKIVWDLLVSTSFFGTGSDVLLPSQFRGELEKVPGVEWATPERWVFNDYEQSKVLLGVMNIREYPHIATDVVEGLPEKELVEAVARGEGVIATSNFASRYKVKAGDTVEVPVPGGQLQPFRVLSVVDDYAPDTGVLYIDEGLFQRFWGERGVDAFAVKLAPGADWQQVKAEMEQRWKAAYRIQVQDSSRFKADFLSMVKAAFAQANMLLLVALLVGGLGIMNTLAIAVMERLREVGTLRALGTSRRQVMKMVVGEALGVGLIAAILGILLGLGVAVEFTAWDRNVQGLLIVFKLVPGLLFAAIIVSLLVAPLAAWWPARFAARVSITEALKYE